MVFDQCKHAELTMTLGDFDAKEGNEKVSGVYGQGEREIRGDNLII